MIKLEEYNKILNTIQNLNYKKNRLEKNIIEEYKIFVLFLIGEFREINDFKIISSERSFRIEDIVYSFEFFRIGKYTLSITTPYSSCRIEKDSIKEIKDYFFNYIKENNKLFFNEYKKIKRLKKYKVIL